MATVVCFRGGDGTEYAVPVEFVREVRRHGVLVPLPSPQRGVAGVFRHDVGTIPVLTAFGGTGSHLLVLDRDGDVFAVVVQEVTKVMTVDGPMEQAPRGQRRECVAGVIATDDGVVMVLDVAQLDERLGA